MFVHPLGRDRRAPDGACRSSIGIDRFSGGAVAGASGAYDITSAPSAGAPPIGPRSTSSSRPREFLDLTDDEKLARPSFEAMPAGVSLGSGGVTFGSQTAVSEMDFDRRIDGAPPSAGNA